MSFAGSRRLAIGGAVAAHFLDGTRSVERIKAKEHLIACLFERDTDAVAVLWCNGEGRTRIALPTAETQPSRAVAAFDMMGNRLIPKDGHVSVGRHPVYVTAGNRRAPALIPLLGLGRRISTMPNASETRP